MKKFIVVLSFVLLVGNGVGNYILAQSSEATKNGYITALKSQKKELVENTLFQIVMNSIYDKDFCFVEIKNELLTLIANTKDERLKRNAKNVYAFLNNKRKIESALKAEYHNIEKLFDVLNNNVTDIKLIAGENN